MSRHRKTYEASRHARFMRPDAHRRIRPDAARWLKPQHPDELKYSPNQPRVPAGQTGGGQWTDGADGNGINDSRVISDAMPDNFWQPGAEFAQVIAICAVGSSSRMVDALGNKTYPVTYECAGGRSSTERGVGHRFPGLVLDRFR